MATEQLKNNIAQKPILDSNEQGLAADELRKDRFKSGSDSNDLSSVVPSKLSNTPGAKEAERDLPEGYGTLSGAWREVKKIKKDRDTESGRLGFRKDQGGLGTIDINNPQARKEKFGVKGGGAQNMTSVMGDLYKRAKEGKNKRSSSNKLQQRAIGAGQDAISMATSNLLQKAWLNVISSYGGTLIYIHFHVFCRFVFGPKIFCKLGHEWSGGGKVGGQIGGASKAVNAGGKSSLNASAQTFFGLPFSVIGMLEGALLIIIDAAILVLAFVSCMPLIILAYMLYDPIGTLWSIFGALWDAAKSILGIPL